MIHLTVFYDGNCPLCAHEIDFLRKRDSYKHIAFEDIQAPDFQARFPEVSYREANRILLARRDDGRWLRGLDVTYEAWRLAGMEVWVAPIKWRWLRPALDRGYFFFARHRSRISALLPGRSRCTACENKLPAR